NLQMIDEGVVAGNRTALLQIMLWYGALTLVIEVFVFLFIFLAGILGQRVQYDLLQKVFDHLQRLSFSYFDRTAVGWIMSRVTSDSDRIADLVTWGMIDVVWAIMNIVTALIFMLIIDWKMALVVFAIIPILVLVAIWFKQKIIGEYRNVRKIN